MLTRTNRIARASSAHFDVIVIGGGVHGANVARELALRDVTVLLLEARDFAFGTSSRSSKLLHGGVRYLEQGDIALVKEALSERSIILSSAPHLARPQEICFPIVAGKTRPEWQVRFGLWLYDSLARLAELFGGGDFSCHFQGHRKIDKSDAQYQAVESMGLEMSALLSYYDAQMDDARIVVETVLDSELLGGQSLNYASVERLSRAADGNWQVAWTDRESGAEYQSSATCVLNAAGPWLPSLHESFGTWQSRWPTPVYSRGVHLLFNVPWQNSGLILPTPTRGRYYFVLPYFSPLGSSTLVGTTDLKVPENEEDPQARESEISELLEYLKKDLPHAGLNASTLYQTFCGMRILAAHRRKDHSKISDVSRAEALLEETGYLAMLGGKYTTGRSSAERAALLVLKRLGKSIPSIREVSTRERVLPGGEGLSAARREELEEQLVEKLLSFATGNDLKEAAAQTAQAALMRFGARAEKLISDTTSADLKYWPNPSSVLPAEVRLVMREEQARTSEDILRRRLAVALEPGGGEELSELIEAQKG